MNTFADGIEAAAKWHERMATTYFGLGMHENAKEHELFALKVRTLTPPAPEPVADQSEAVGKCIDDNGTPMAEPSNCGGVATHRISECLGNSHALRRFKSGRHESVVGQSGSPPPGSVVLYTIAEAVRLIHHYYPPEVDTSGDTSDFAKISRAYLALLARGTRTPGTVEVCERGPNGCDTMYECQWEDCERDDCPIRAAQEKR